MTKSIVCLQPLTPQQQERITAAAPGYRFAVTDGKNPDAALLETAEIVIGWPRHGGELLLRPESPLRWVQAWSAGVEKLPLEQLRERGIILTNASGVHAEPIAGVIFGFMLMFTRNLHMAVRNQIGRQWKPLGTESELTGKTAVIAGTGAIGGETARIAKAFRMNTLGVSRSGEAAEHFDEVWTTERLGEAAGRGDFIINTLPLTDETRQLFDAKLFSAFKDGAYYINIGRGATTHTGDLIAALNSGKIAGAGLDVFEAEPLPAEHPLWGMEQVIITPHNAGLTDRYADRLVDIFTDNLQAYISSGDVRRNKVDYSRQY